MEKYKIDASGKILGRVATEIAIVLRGKNKPSFYPHKDEVHSVEVENVEKLTLSGNKRGKKLYWHHSGYPGGIKRKTYEELVEGDPSEALRRAVYGMLPKNKLRDRMMVRLTIK